MRIYKVFRAAEWTELERTGETAGSPDDQRDGYVHFSPKDALGETLARHYKAEHNLILVACETDDMGDDLKWEEARDGAEFPHLYRKLTRDDVLWHREIPRDGIDQLTLGEE